MKAISCRPWPNEPWPCWIPQRMMWSFAPAPWFTGLAWWRLRLWIIWLRPSLKVNQRHQTGPHKRSSCAKMGHTSCHSIYSIDGRGKRLELYTQNLSSGYHQVALQVETRSSIAMPVSGSLSDSKLFMRFVTFLRRYARMELVPSVLEQLWN